MSDDIANIKTAEDAEGVELAALAATSGEAIAKINELLAAAGSANDPAQVAALIAEAQQHAQAAADANVALTAALQPPAPATPA